MILALDESGNTGSNWNDTNQPYFVYGGWLFADGYYYEAEKYFEQLFSFSMAEEVKSRRIIEHNIGAFYDMINCFIKDYNGVPVVVIADKKYMIAAKIVETFFDYAYNPNVGVELTRQLELKKALASFLYEENEVILLFSELIANGTICIEKMKKVQYLIENAFKNAAQDEVAYCISNLDDSNLFKMIDEYSTLLGRGKRKAWLSLTVPLLADIFVNIDNLGEIFGEPIEVRVDRLNGFTETFQELEDINQRKGIVNMVSTITEYDSRNEKMVQAADLLCGFINRALVNP